MFDARPFIAAIRAAPDDDAPRLVFADWLAEQGQLPPGNVILRRALEGVSRQPLQSYPNWKFDPKKTLIQVEENVAVMCRNVSDILYLVGEDCLRRPETYTKLWLEMEARGPKCSIS